MSETMNQNLNTLLTEARSRLTAAGVETSAYELRLLLGAACGADAAALAFSDIEPTAEQRAAFEDMLSRRLARMPVDKILGRRGFYKYDFQVSADVLSPRPDTEILLEAALQFIHRSGARNILELGVGSGCIITSLLAECPLLVGVGIDISSKALQVAAANAAALSVDNRLKLQNGDWFAKDFLSRVGETFDVIVSNPPYIPSAEIAGLDAEVRLYDPLPALDGGADGLSSYRRIAELAPALLSPGGKIFLEVGERQAEDVMAVFTANGLVPQQIWSDLSGIERCISLKK